MAHLFCLIGICTFSLAGVAYSAWAQTAVTPTPTPSISPKPVPSVSPGPGAQPSASANLAVPATNLTLPATVSAVTRATPVVHAKQLPRAKKGELHFSTQPSQMPAILKEIEAKYQQANSITSDFTQLNESSAMEGIQKAKPTHGTISIQKPDKIRWETVAPDANLLISNGQTLWVYTPPFDEGERGQLIQRPASQFQSKFARALLAGSFSKTKGIQIAELGPEKFVIVPRKGSAGTVARAEIEVDPTQKLIHKIILNHSDGNRSEINLSNIDLSRKLPDSLFEFKAPANTDRMDE